MKDFLLLTLAIALGGFIQGFLTAGIKSGTKALFGGDTPRFRWSDSQLLRRVRMSVNGAGGVSSAWKTVINLQTPARRREVREEHERWVKRMATDYNMDFSHTL